MNTLGRLTLLLMIPLNLILIVWVWIGRIVFGVGGWFFLIFLGTVVPVLLIALLVTTILALTQHGRPRALTVSQTVAQLMTWLGLLVWGAFQPDFADNDNSHISLLTQVFGASDSMLSASYLIVLVAGLSTVAAYVVLLVMLIVERRAATPGAPLVQHAPAAATPEGDGR